MVVFPALGGEGADGAAGGLDRLLDEASAARRLRWRGRPASGSSTVSDGSGGMPAALLPRCASAMLQVERLVADGAGGRVDLASLLTRVGTSLQLGWPAGSDLVSSFATAPVPRRFARAVASALVEMVDVLESGRPPGRRPTMFLASSVEGGMLVVAAGARDGAPVAGAGAARSFARAARIVRALGGGLTRGMDGNMHLLALSVTLPPAPCAPDAP